MLKFFHEAFRLVYANSLDPFVPEFWAQESLAILEENMVAANLIHRDFSPIIANYGDVVNTRKPGEYVAKRKTDTDDVTIQDSTATNVQVPLNQHLHVSFMIRDGEESKSMKDLVNEYMRPAMIAQARMLDRIVLGQHAQWIGAGNNYVAGQLGQLSSSTSKRKILETRQGLNILKCYDQGRNLILNPYSETECLDTDLFVSAERVGDQGTALREASLGRKLGFDFFMDQNMSFVDTNGTVDRSVAGTINQTGGYAAGSTSAMVTANIASPTVGSWVTIAGDYNPAIVTASGATSITLDRALRSSVANGAVISYYRKAVVNQAVSPTGYAAGYAKYIALDGFTSGKFLQVGQILSFGTAAGGNRANYVVVDVTGASGTDQQVLLDRPLDYAIADGDSAFPGPAGAYNFAFHRNSIALVSRPLSLPKTPGVLAAVVNYNGLSVRAVISYQAKEQGHLVTLDYLCGIKVLELGLGTVLLG